MDATLRSKTPLRPLSLGEVLDRAVSLTVRSFAILALIYLVIAIPLAVVSYYVNASYAPLIGNLTHDIQAGATGEAILRNFSRYQSPSGWTGLALVMQLFLAPLPAAAPISATATIYFGGAANFRDAYRVGLARWVQLLLLTIIWIAAGLATYLAVVLVLVIVGIGIAALVVAFKTIGIVIAVVAGTVALLFTLALAVVAYLAYQISTVALVVENATFIEAFVAGIRRVFSGIGIRRSLLVGLIFSVIAFALGVATALGSGLFLAVVHNTLLGTLYATVLRIVAQTFTAAFVTIFYFDLRVREDGLDLELAAAARPPSGVVST